MFDDEPREPWCAACDQPVESFVCHHETFGLVLIARCHGEVERVEVGYRELGAYGRVVLGVAFAQTSTLALRR